MNETDKSITEIITEVRDSYVAHLRAELEQLERHAGQLLVDIDKQNALEELHHRLHQLAGSAGIFGFKRLGILARELDALVRGFLDNTKTVGQEECAGFAAIIVNMKKELLRDRDVTMDMEAIQDCGEGNNLSSTEKLKILIVDDDRTYCGLISTTLKHKYDVVTAFTGAEALQCCQRDNPDIIFLDIELPDMNGYEVCPRIKESGLAEWCSIIFVSGNNSLQDRLRAFDAGGDDFITKPFELATFSTKLKSLAAYTQSKKQLIAQNQFTQTMVFETMAESAQYGHLVNFLRQAMECESVEDLVRLFFDVAEKFGLNTSLCLRGTEITCFSANQQPCSPIETNLFEIVQYMGRLFHFGARTIVNDDHVSFLIKNMPIEDEKEYGRLKDIIAVLSEAMESSFLSIQRKQSLSNAVIRVDAIQERLISMFSPDSGVTQSLKRLSGFMNDLESSFHFLDLSEEQENMLYGLLETGENDADRMLDIMEDMQEDVLQLSEALRIK